MYKNRGPVNRNPRVWSARPEYNFPSHIDQSAGNACLVSSCLRSEARFWRCELQWNSSVLSRAPSIRGRDFMHGLDGGSRYVESLTRFTRLSRSSESFLEISAPALDYGSFAIPSSNVWSSVKSDIQIPSNSSKFKQIQHSAFPGLEFGSSNGSPRILFPRILFPLRPSEHQVSTPSRYPPP